MRKPDTLPTTPLPGLDGHVIAPGDPGYERARKVRHPSTDVRPAAIVQAASVGDVATTVRFAAETGLPLAVRSGGHSVAGHGTVEGGIVLDLRGLRSIELDPATRTAQAGGGVTAGEYNDAAGEHGLATGFGDAATVGIAGLTLGGGVGYLSRRLGLTIDSLLGAELVTAEGEVREVSDNSDPELMWALRGGGGGFGVVTRLRLRLHELTRFTGGMLILPAEPEVIAGLVAAAQDAPRELSSIVNVMPAPPMPMVPEQLRGRPVAMAMLAYAGPSAAAERALAPIRSLAEPLFDGVAEQPYGGMFPPEDADAPNPDAELRTFYADGLTSAGAESIVDGLAELPAGMGVVQLRVLGGAIADVPAAATAYAHRDRRLMATAVSMHDDPAQVPAAELWVEGMRERLRSGAPGAYVNFLSGEGPDRLREAYPAKTWARLAAIKARVDPENLFRLNHTVPPAPDAAEAAAPRQAAPIG